MHSTELPKFGSTDPRYILTLAATNGRGLVSRAGTGSSRRFGGTSEVRKTRTPNLSESGGSDLPSCGRLHGYKSGTSVLPNLRSPEEPNPGAGWAWLTPNARAWKLVSLQTSAPLLPNFRSLEDDRVGSYELRKFASAFQYPCRRWPLVAPNF